MLLAYSCHDPDVGYCQGINRLAAVALLFMDEEDAFWCLDCIINCLHPPHYYTKSLLGSQTDQVTLITCLWYKYDGFVIKCLDPLDVSINALYMYVQTPSELLIPLVYYGSP